MSSGPLQEVKNNGKSLTVRPKKWSWLLTGDGCLLEVTTVRLIGWGNFGVLDWWPFMGGGCVWKFDCIWKHFVVGCP